MDLLSALQSLSQLCGCSGRPRSVNVKKDISHQLLLVLETWQIPQDIVSIFKWL